MLRLKSDSHASHAGPQVPAPRTQMSSAELSELSSAPSADSNGQPALARLGAVGRGLSGFGHDVADTWSACVSVLGPELQPEP